MLRRITTRSGEGQISAPDVPPPRTMADIAKSPPGSGNAVRGAAGCGHRHLGGVWGWGFPLMRASGSVPGGALRWVKSSGISAIFPLSLTSFCTIFPTANQETDKNHLVALTANKMSTESQTCSFSEAKSIEQQRFAHSTSFCPVPSRFKREPSPRQPQTLKKEDYKPTKDMLA